MPELDEWLHRHASVAQSVGGARTYVICEGKTMRGYYTLAVTSVEFAHVSAKVRAGLGRYPVSTIEHERSTSGTTSNARPPIRST